MGNPTKQRPPPKSKLTDAERHKRFVDMAHEVEASTDPNDFDEAFEKVARHSSAVSDEKIHSRQRSKPTER